MIGKTIKDRYEIVAKIGEGGMGVVYKALDKTLRRLVAIKMLHPTQSNQMLKTRFQVEAKSPNQQLNDIYKELLNTETNSTKQLESKFIEVLNQQDSANVRNVWFWHG